jgi:hypothetical protein
MLQSNKGLIVGGLFALGIGLGVGYGVTANLPAYAFVLGPTPEGKVHVQKDSVTMKSPLGNFEVRW